MLLLMVQSRKDFETELIDRFGCLVKMPLLKPDRSDACPHKILLLYCLPCDHLYLLDYSTRRYMDIWNHFVAFLYVSLCWLTEYFYKYLAICLCFRKFCVLILFLVAEMSPYGLL